MPSAMPPSGGPPGSQEPPSSAGPGAPQESQGAGDGGAISSLLMNVDKAIDHLNLVIGQSKATNPQEKQLIAKVDDLYGKLMSSLGAQDDGGEQAPPPGPGAQGQTVPPEAAGNKGAMPSPM